LAILLMCSKIAAAGTNLAVIGCRCRLLRLPGPDSLCLSAGARLSLPVCLSACLPVCLPACMSACLRWRRLVAGMPVTVPPLPARCQHAAGRGHQAQHGTLDPTGGHAIQLEGVASCYAKGYTTNTILITLRTYILISVYLKSIRTFSDECARRSAKVYGHPAIAAKSTQVQGLVMMSATFFSASPFSP
jgi:hypothetical protein